jgi:cobalamin biosynthesis protein CobT
MMIRKKSVFEPNKAGALRNLAAHLSDEHDVQMIYDVRNAPGWLATDGKRIFVPMIPDYLVDSFRNILYPGVWHEATHIARSDFKVKPTIKSPIEITLFSYLEDVRCEYHESKKNPIAGDEFRNIRKWLIEVEKQKYEDPVYEEVAMTTPSEILRMIGLSIYLKLFDLDISFLPDEIIQIHNSIIGDINKFIAKSDPGRHGTHQVKEQAKKTAKHLKKFLDEKKKEQEQKRKEEEERRRKEEEERRKEQEDGDDDGSDEWDDDGPCGDSDDSNDDSDSSRGGHGEENDDEGEDPFEEDEKPTKGRKKVEEEESSDEFDEEVDEEDSPSMPDEEGPTNDGDSDGNDTDGDTTKERTEEEEMNVHIEMREGELDDEHEDYGEGDSPSEITPDEDGSASVTLRSTENDDEQDEGDGKTLGDLIEEANENDVKDLFVEILTDTSEKIQDYMSVTSKTQHIPHPDAMKEDSEDVPRLSRTDHSRREYLKIESEVASEIRKLSTKTEALIMSKKRTHLIPDRTEGEIDPAALHSIRSGNTRVFRAKEHVRRLNTAIILLGDESASMAGVNKIGGVQKALIACGKQCYRMKTPFEILGFSTRTRTSPAYMRFKNMRDTPNKQAMLQQYNRFEPLNHTIYKAFEEDFNTVRYRLLQMRIHSCNSDSESVLWAANRLAVRPERRKILIVFSDGWPNLDMSDNDVMDNELKKTVKRLTASGIEVYGIGIYTDAVRHFYPNYSIIEKGKDNIAEAIFAVLSGKLMTSAGL